MTRLRLLEVIVACAFIALVSGAAMAITTTNDQRPPRTRLVTDGHHQVGRLDAHDWEMRVSADACVNEEGLGSLEFSRDGLHVGTGTHRINVTFFKAQRPNQTQVLVWRQVDSNHQPAGKSTTLHYRLRHRGRDGRSRWIARFSVLVNSDAYLAVYGRWHDEEGCGGQQDATWLFHLAP
jgi:hypothetical protein